MRRDNLQLLLKILVFVVFEDLFLALCCTSFYLKIFLQFVEIILRPNLGRLFDLLLNGDCKDISILLLKFCRRRKPGFFRLCIFLGFKDVKAAAILA